MNAKEDVVKGRVFNVMEDIKALLTEVENSYEDFADVRRAVIKAEDTAEFDIGYYEGLNTALNIIQKHLNI